MADLVEVNADLVGPARDEIELEQGSSPQALAHAVARDRGPAVRHAAMPRPLARVAPDRRLDPPTAADTDPARARDTSFF